MNVQEEISVRLHYYVNSKFGGKIDAKLEFNVEYYVDSIGGPYGSTYAYQESLEIEVLSWSLRTDEDLYERDVELPYMGDDAPLRLSGEDITDMFSEAEIRYAIEEFITKPR
jgi:hypothetical protein